MEPRSKRKEVETAGTTNLKNEHESKSHTIRVKLWFFNWKTRFCQRGFRICATFFHTVERPQRKNEPRIPERRGSELPPTESSARVAVLNVFSLVPFRVFSRPGLSSAVHIKKPHGDHRSADFRLENEVVSARFRGFDDSQSASIRGFRFIRRSRTRTQIGSQTESKE